MAMYYDIINFEISETEQKSLGIKCYQFKDCKDKIAIGSADRLIKSLRKARILYCPSYEISLELFAKAGAQNKPFLISISDLLKENSYLTIYRLSNFIRVARHYKITLIIASMANDIYSLRDPEEAASILRLCGMTREQVRYGFSILNRYLD